MKKFFQKNLGIFFIFGLWILFSSPYIFQHKVPFPADYQVNFFAPWSAYPEFTSPVKNSAMPDVVTQIYPWKKLVIESWREGRVPLWNPYSLSGTPLLANYQSAALSPFNILFFILPFNDAWSLLILLQPLLAGIFMYLFLKKVTRITAGSLIGAIGFMFSGFITTWMAYGTLGYAILFLPLALYLLELYRESSDDKWLVFTAITIPLSFLSGHFQISLYFALGLLLYPLFIFGKKDILKIFLFLGFGFLLVMPQLLPTIEFYLNSSRSGIFQKLEAIPFNYLVTLFSPDFYGNPVTRNDWFGHYAEWNGYTGLITLMLAFFSLVGKKSARVYYLYLLSFVAILFSINSPLLDFLINLKIPVLSTSAAGRTIVLLTFAVSGLSAFGYKSLQRKSRKHLVLIFTASLFFGLIWSLILLKIAFVPIEKIGIARQNFILPSILFAGFCVGFFFSKYRKLFTLLLIFLVTAEMFRFSFKWQPFISEKLVFPKVSIGKQFTAISEKERFFGNLEGAAYNFYRLPSLEGYEPLYSTRYAEFISSLESGQIKSLERSVVYVPKNGTFTKTGLNLLNSKYFINKVSDFKAPWVFPYWKYDNLFIPVHKEYNFEIFENKEALPRAFLASGYVVKNSKNEIIKTLFDKDFKYREIVVLEEDPGIKDLRSRGSVSIVKNKPEEVEFLVKNNGNGLLFISDSLLPGWRAFIDGKETKILRADYAFRAVPITKGEHAVALVYFPDSFKFGLIFGVVGIFGIIGLFIAPKILSRKVSSSS